MRPRSRAARALALLVVLAACKEQRPAQQDCPRNEEAPRCPDATQSAAAASAGAGSAAVSASVAVAASAAPSASSDELCGGLKELDQLPEAIRVVGGDILIGTTTGAALNPADAVVKTAMKGGALEAEPAVTWAGTLIRDRNHYGTTNIFSAPQGPTARDALKPYLRAGSLPKDSGGEIAIGHKLAKLVGVALGDTVSIYGNPSSATSIPSSKKVKVVGLLDFPFAPMLEYDDMLSYVSVSDARDLAVMLANTATMVRVWLPKTDRAAASLKLFDAFRGDPAASTYSSVSSEQLVQRIDMFRSLFQNMCNETPL
ncbi:MAG: hypothetical protein U0271_06950 [Polyangiaceae bacterium]